MAIPDSKKTIVFDVDETILTTANRDYKNSQPKAEVIEGLRALKNAGWYVILQTARGMGRSNGDIESVREQVTAEITKFCQEHNVPYDELVLGKPWAAWYVDDRGMRPEEFAAQYKTIMG
jgi:capsule biosynthesis phosphatase